jgi:predicted Zn-dependent protease
MSSSRRYRRRAAERTTQASFGGAMTQDLIANLEALLAQGNDAPSLRFALATRYLAAGDAAAAVRHAAASVELDAAYSAGWKVLGQARAASGDERGAADAFRRGIDVADARGDRQAVKEMQVFLRRIEKRAAGPPRGDDTER